MNHDITEGMDILIPDLGIVHVIKMYPSGSAIVGDTNGVRWLVSAGTLRTGELCLFS